MTHFSWDDGEEGNYVMACGCWSGQSDHTCQREPVSDTENPYGYCHGCGVPDDCYCHEDCDRYPCNWHAWEQRAEREADHAEALAMIARGEQC